MTSFPVSLVANLIKNPSSTSLSAVFIFFGASEFLVDTL